MAFTFLDFNTPLKNIHAPSQIDSSSLLLRFMDHCPSRSAKGRLSWLMEHERMTLHQTPIHDSDLHVCHSDELFVSNNLLNSEGTPSGADLMAARGMPPRSPPSPWSHSPLHSPSPSLFHTCIASLRRLEGCIHSIALSKALVFTSSDSRRIRVWSSNECADLGYIKVKSGEIRSILCKDNMIFTAHKDYKIRIWNFSSNAHFKKAMTLPKRNPLFQFISNNNQQITHKDKISCMAYNRAEGLLYTGSWDRTVRVWNIRDRICQDIIYAHEDSINAILIDHEGNGSIFTCSSDGSIKIWNKDFGERFHTLIMALKFPFCSMNALALSATNDHTEFKTSILYAGSSDGLVNFWIKDKDSARYNHGGFFQGHSFAVLCLTTIDNLLFSGSEDTMIRVWRRGEREGTCTHACLAVLQGHRGPVKCIAACPDSDKRSVKGFLVYTGGLDKSFKVWRIRVMADDGRRSMDIGDEPHRRTTSMKYGLSESCDPILSPAWVEKRLSGPMN